MWRHPETSNSGKSERSREESSVAGAHEKELGPWEPWMRRHPAAGRKAVLR